MVKALPFLALYFDAETAHEIERDFDVGLGNQFADHFDVHVLPGQRRRHQQRGEELAGDVAANLDFACGVNGGRLDGQRRKTFVAEIADIGTELAQAIDQVADGPLVHARHAAEMVFALAQGQHGGQRAEGGAGVAEEQFGLLDGKCASCAMDSIVAAVAVLFPFDTKFFQRHQHVAGVVRRQQRLDFGHAFGQRGQQQGAVGNAFRTGQHNAAADAGDGGKIDVFHEVGLL